MSVNYRWYAKHAFCLQAIDIVMKSGLAFSPDIPAAGGYEVRLLGEAEIPKLMEFHDSRCVRLSNVFTREEAGGTAVCRLRDAEAWAAFAADVERAGDEAIVVRLTLLKEEVLDLRLHPVNRGFASIVDATVHATRYVGNRDPWLGRLIEHHAGLARKCGGPREWEALDLLLRYIADPARE